MTPVEERIDHAPSPFDAAAFSALMFLELARYVPVVAVVFGVLGLILGAGLASMIWWLP